MRVITHLRLLTHTHRSDHRSFHNRCFLRTRIKLWMRPQSGAKPCRRDLAQEPDLIVQLLQVFHPRGRIFECAAGDLIGGMLFQPFQNKRS
jgi:hypothetical protein